MQLNQFENGIECQVKRVRDRIQFQGIHVQHEGGYSYTVGLSSETIPELVIKHDQGFSKSDVEELATALRQCVSLSEFHQSLSSAGLECTSITEFEKRRCFYSARLYYGNWEFNAVKVFLGDSSE